MAMEALSDVTRGGVSAFSASGGGGATTVTDANLATAIGDYILGSPYTNSPYTSAGAIRTTVENGRVYQRGHFWVSTFSIVAPHERYFNGTAWSSWAQVAKYGEAAKFNQVSTNFNDLGSVSGAVPLDPVSGGILRATMTADTTFSFNTIWLIAGNSAAFNLELYGAYTPSWPAGIVWLGGNPPPYIPGMLYSFVVRRETAGTTVVFGFAAMSLGAVKAVTSSAGVLDLSAITAETVTVDLTENITSVLLPAGVVAGRRELLIEFTQAGSGLYTVAGWASVAYESGVAPAIATGVGVVTEVILSNVDNGGWRMISGDASTAVVTVASAAGALNLSAVVANNIQVTLTENITSITLPTGLAGACRDLTIQFTQDATGRRTVAGWPAGTVTPDGTPLIMPAASQSSQVRLTRFGTTPWYIFSAPPGGKSPAKIPVGQRHVAGTASGTALGTVSAVASRIWYIPFVPKKRMTVSSLGINVTTLTAGTATVGIYAADGNASYDYPGTRLAVSTTGALDTGSTGTKTAACSAVLEAGKLYFIAVICSAACTLRSVTAASAGVELGWTDNAGTITTCYYSAGSTNVLPATAGAPTVNNVAMPAMYVIE